MKPVLFIGAVICIRCLFYRGPRSPAPGVLAQDEPYLKELLVEVTSKEGWRWTSSLTRTDRGGEACELILVESLFVW